MTIARTATTQSCTNLKAHRPSFFARLMQWAALGRQRKALLNLDQHLLQDIGLTNAEAIEEAERAPWDVPAHWRSGC